MSVIDKGKTIEVLMADNDTLKVCSNDERGETIIIQCKKDKLIVSKTKEDDNIAMAISLSNELMNKNE